MDDCPFLKQPGYFWALKFIFGKLRQGFAGFFGNSAQAVLQRSMSDYMMPAMHKSQKLGGALRALISPILKQVVGAEAREPAPPAKRRKRVPRRRKGRARAFVSRSLCKGVAPSAPSPGGSRSPARGEGCHLRRGERGERRRHQCRDLELGHGARRSLGWPRGSRPVLATGFAGSAGPRGFAQLVRARA